MPKRARTHISAIPALALCTLAAGLLPASARAAVPTLPLEGFWRLERVQAPPAALKRDIVERNAALAKLSSGAQFIPYAKRWCLLIGFPQMMLPPSEPIHIVADEREVAVLSPLRSSPRHIYLGVGHPPSDELDPTSNGHSVGRIEGDALVVDTVAFSEIGDTVLPGGGRRTQNAKVTERFRILDGGQRLSVTTTWSDASVFDRPYTYDVTYTRVADHFHDSEFCDPSVTPPAGSVVGPAKP